MKQQLNVEELLKGTPRPHYLMGKAEYEKKDNKHKLQAKVNFKSEGHPSIQDRAKNYVSIPHVNVGDCCFALWNAVHILAGLEGYKFRTLRKEIVVVPKNIIPPDIELDLEAKVTEEKSVIKKQETFYLGTINGVFFHKGIELVNISASYCAKK